MKEKHIRTWIDVCTAIAKTSECPRHPGGFGAVIINPERNTVISTGYNGGPRGGGTLCGGDHCLRESMKIESGTRLEIGCHHAEENAVCNAASNGHATQGGWIFVNGEPCLMCAKLIHHSGIKKVYVIKGRYTQNNGLDYLRTVDIPVEYVEEKCGEEDCQQ